MNQVLREGAEVARLGWMMGLTTIMFTTVMVGWTWWAWLPSNRSRLEEAALLPLEGGGR